MPTYEIWIQSWNVDKLKFLMEYYEKEVEREFGGMSFNWEKRLGRRHRIGKPKINESYVVQRAVEAHFLEIEAKMESEKRERERIASQESHWPQRSSQNQSNARPWKATK